MSDRTNNGWNEYSRLVLEQLEVLSMGIDSIRIELQSVNQELTIIKAKEDKVNELRAWKEKIDEITSPTQLKTYFIPSGTSISAIQFDGVFFFFSSLCWAKICFNSENFDGFTYFEYFEPQTDFHSNTTSNSFFSIKRLKN